MLPAPDRPRRRATGIALLATAALLACAPGASHVPGRGSATRLELRGSSSATGGVAPREARAVAELRPEGAAWTVEGAPSELRHFEDGAAPALAVVPGTEFAVRVPLECEPFQRVVLDVRSPRQGVAREMLVSLRSPTGDERRSPSRALDPAPGVQTFVFEFRDLRAREDTPSALFVHVGGSTGPFALERVRLESVPLASFLPDPSGPAELVAIGGDLRRGHGLAAGEALVGAARAPAGARLALSYGVPPELADAGTHARLVVAADAGGRRAVRRLALEPGWRSAVLPLDAREGALVRVRVELESDGPAVGAVAEARLESLGEEAPTVLLVTSDTHRGDHLGAARGAAQVRTPTLDALAARGVLFERSFASTNITNPSHAALLTGLHPRDTRIVDNQHALADAAETLAEHFAAAGFETWASVSARHLRPEISGLGQGFARFAVPAGHHHDADDAAGAIERWLPDADGRPLFVWLHLFDAHHPYGPPAPFDRRYYPADEDPFDPALPPPDVPRKILPYDLEGLRDLRFPLAQYRAEVDYLDHVLGRLLERPRFDDAIVAVTADHGESLGHHGIWFSHGGLYPASLHVPLVLAWPGAPAGTRVSGTVGHLGLGRALLELAEVPSAGRFPRPSLLEHLEDGPRPDRPVFTLSDHGTIASITRGEWHLILHLRRHHRRESTEPKERHQVELYDLVRDPGCKTDLVRERPQLARELCAELVEWLRSPAAEGRVGARSDDAELLEGLRALGYAEEPVGPAGPAGGAGAASWIDDDFDLDENAWLRRP